MGNFTGKSVLVTGAGRGIGRGIAMAFAAEGANVVLGYCGNDEAAGKTLSEIEAAGGHAALFKGNVSDSGEVSAMTDFAVKTFGRLDVLVNNAGITRDGLALRMSDEDFDRVIDVNLRGCFLCCRAAGKYMMKQRSGAIVNISSIVGISGNAGQANYAASKAGVIGLTKSLAKEFSAWGIRVNSVAPGFVETDMTGVLSEKLRESMLSSVPLKRPGQPEDIAGAVLFLAGQSASYSTGQVLTVDGGMSL